MADEGGDDVHREAFQVAYYGDIPDDHSLDVEALAPALLGFGRLVREANATLNGDAARIRLLVTSDFEHKCFHINFELVQTAVEKLKTLLQDERVKTAKELLQIIGVVRSARLGTLLDFLKWKKDKPVTKIDKAPEQPGLITIQITGSDNTINISPEVFKLAENRRVLEAVKDTLAPIDMNEARRIEFKEHDQPVLSLDKAEARDIELACDVPEALAPDDPVAEATPDTIVATLYVYSPVFDEKAKRWRFVYGRDRKHIYADISGTTIAADAIKRGGSFMNDRYRVRMEVTPPDSSDGEPHHKIVQVLEFTPAPQQGALQLPKPRQKVEREVRDVPLPAPRPEQDKSKKRTAKKTSRKRNRKSK